MDYTERKNSLLTHKNTLEHLYSFQNFPVFIGCTEQSQDQDVRADMVFDICKETGLIQLKNLLPLDVVYSGFHSEALGGVWKLHHEELGKFVSKFNPTEVLEIGGSNGSLAELVMQSHPNVSWTIIEPNPPERLPNPKIKLITAYFNESFLPNTPPAMVVHSHLLEHLYEPVEALEHMHKILPEGGRQIFSIPNLLKWLQNKFPNTLNFEHTIFLTEEITDYLLSACGFKILEKHYFQEHSIFYAIEKNSAAQGLLPTPNKYEEYKKLYMDFVAYQVKEAADLNEKINKFSGNVFLFGAHVFSQALLQLGLNEARIKGILDNSRIKQGKRLYGSNLTVFIPETVKEIPEVAVVLRAGVYNKEITAQLLELNPKLIIL